jgi:hypothetical protein
MKEKLYPSELEHMGRAHARKQGLGYELNFIKNLLREGVMLRKTGGKS